MLKLESLEDLEKLHTNQAMESTTLEYKASAAVDQSKKDEIAKTYQLWPMRKAVSSYMA
jgi:hypothetical protein